MWQLHKPQHPCPPKKDSSWTKLLVSYSSTEEKKNSLDTLKFFIEKQYINSFLQIQGAKYGVYYHHCSSTMTSKSQSKLALPPFPPPTWWSILPLMDLADRVKETEFQQASPQIQNPQWGPSAFQPEPWGMYRSLAPGRQKESSDRALVCHPGKLSNTRKPPLSGLGRQELILVKLLSISLSAWLVSLF